MKPKYCTICGKRANVEATDEITCWVTMCQNSKCPSYGFDIIVYYS